MIFLIFLVQIGEILIVYAILVLKCDEIGIFLGFVCLIIGFRCEMGFGIVFERDALTNEHFEECMRAFWILN